MSYYTIKHLVEISGGKTERAVRQLFKTNKTLKSAEFQAHIYRDEITNRVYYDEVIYNWIKEYYARKNQQLVEDEVGEGIEEAAHTEKPQTNPPLVDVKASANPESEQVETIKTLEAQIAKYEAELQIKTAEVDSLKQIRDSLTEANAALEGRFSAQEARIAEQAQEIESNREQIQRLTVANQALSITVNREQTARLLAEAKKPPLLERIKRLLSGKTAATATETAPEAVVIEPESAESE